MKIFTERNEFGSCGIAHVLPQNKITELISWKQFLPYNNFPKKSALWEEDIAKKKNHLSDRKKERYCHIWHLNEKKTYVVARIVNAKAGWRI